jgi:nucleoside-diphosphate-sugar epimerase
VSQDRRAGGDAGLRGSTRSYHGVTALVLGASGFIGRWVTRALVLKGARVVAVARDAAAIGAARKSWNGPVEVVGCDVSDFAALAHTVTAVRPAITFNLAGYGVAAGERDAAIAQRLNAELVVALGTALVTARDADWSGLALVNAGSSAEYGQTDGPVSGDGPAEPITDYGRAKLAGSLGLARLCQQHDLPGATARLFMVYGGGEHPHRLFPSLLRAARTGEAMALSDGRQRLDFTYVEDVAEGLLRLGVSEPATGEIVNLATGRLTQVRTFVHTAAELLGLKPEQLRFGEAAPRPDDVRYGPVRTSRFHQITHWTASTSIVEGIRRTLDHVSTDELDERDG